MTWTTESKLNALLRLPWTIRVSREGDDSTVTIEELPEFIMVFSALVFSAKEAQEAAEKEFWSALRNNLRSYLEHDDRVPVPGAAGRPMPWEEGGTSLQPVRRRLVVRVPQNGARPVVEEVEELVA